ncbi:MAG: hypothetical protein WBB41_10395 [Candidatus Nanopelagicales bacterium]
MSFATVSQMSTRLGRTFSVGAEPSQAQAMLDDATAYLVGEIGGQLVEAGTAVVTLTVDPSTDRVRLPQWPVSAVNSVELNTVAITDWTLVGGHLVRVGGWPAVAGSTHARVDVDFDYGMATVPPELTSWTCVLAAGALAQVGRAGTLSAAGVASERIDDYAVNYEPGATALALPERVLTRLRASYGAGAHVVRSA